MFRYPKRYDVIVVGAGHAGTEAALAAARMGHSTLILTMNLDTIGQMSCNPAIGGLAKGHLVREIDALGGEMGRCTDIAGIQFRMLNTKKGPSVWAPRAQCDKKAYQFCMKWTCERTENLECRQGQISELVVEDGQVMGVLTNFDVFYPATCVILTTGTFLRGLMHIGNGQQEGGRSAEPAAQHLSGSLSRLGMELGRMKTGTPPRLLRRSIDFEQMTIQPGDDPPPLFSYWHGSLGIDTGRVGCSTWNSPNPETSMLNRSGGQIPCYLTQTTSKTRTLILDNLHRSAMYSGAILGVGPRYCPSIEDKIVRFADKPRHQIFLEPEGIATDEFYLNGCSTSLPYAVQIELVRTIIGCERAEIMRPAYAVEYDFAQPTQLQATLESKLCRNLFCAGQINGTSGYEEAAAQGLIAGINAARRVQNNSPIILRRDQGYIGVLVDDLVTKGTTEPYRLFTSRAEFRLLLRQDNADLRLCEIGYSIGLLRSNSYRQFCHKRKLIETEMQRLANVRVGSITLLQILKRPEVRYEDLPSADLKLPLTVIQEVENRVKYAGYIDRQADDVSKSQALESKQIPPTFDYSLISGLRTEAIQKLAAVRPRTIGQASRISGVSPADVNLILVHLKRI